MTAPAKHPNSPYQQTNDDGMDYVESVAAIEDGSDSSKGYAINDVESSVADNNKSGGSNLKKMLRSAFIFVDYPISVWFILLNELMERYAFYGFKSILALYCMNYLHLPRETATVIVHLFIAGVYFFPLLGGFLADGIMGKFWTILSMSLIYAAGQVITAVTAIPGVTGPADQPHWWGLAIGLVLVALGSGGIKPNVASFGADQFKLPAQLEHQISFFGIFYIAINVGSVASTLVTPILRDNYGPAIAFAVPAVLLVGAIVVFALGRPMYRIQRPERNVYTQTIKVIFHATKNTFAKEFRGRKFKHWVDRASETFDPKLVVDVRYALQVIPLLVPMLFFSALYDQQSSRWIFQASQMDRTLLFGKSMAPDQMGVFNPLQILILVPLFDRVIYKILPRFVKVTPLRRIGSGFVMAALSYVVSGVLQIFVELFPEKIHIFFQLPQYIIMGCAEILVMTTMLEFAYGQAPKSMKSVMMSMYQLMVAFGNVTVVITASISSAIPNKPNFWTAGECFFFAVMIIVLALVPFLLMSLKYQYRTFNDDGTVSTDGKTVSSSDDDSRDHEPIADKSTTEEDSLADENAPLMGGSYN